MEDTHIARLVTTAPPAPGGFAGAGHMAVEVVSPQDFTRNDSFIVLMDDRLDLPEGGLVGGPHPHAGFETVTLLLEGSLLDRDEGVAETGDVQWMTTGRGIIHNEHVEARGKVCLLQL